MCVTINLNHVLSLFIILMISTNQSLEGMVVQPYFDSLLVKYTATHKTWDGAIRRMRRALRENHIRGVKTNIPFLLNGKFVMNFSS